MAVTTLKAVSLRNWATVRDSVIEFPSHGLVLVRGVNTAAKGRMESIGSGKTALGEAISRTLLAVRGRFTNLGQFSYNEKGNCYVDLHCVHSGKPLRVELGFKAKEINGAGEGLRYTYDGQQVYRDSNANTRKDLTKLLTVPTALANWTVHLDGDTLKFDDLAEKSAVDLLMAALRQPSWTSMSKQANEAASEYRRDVTNSEQTLADAHTDAAEANDDVLAAEDRLKCAIATYEKAKKENKKLLADVKQQLTAQAEAAVTRAKQRATLVAEITRRTELNAAKIKQAEQKVRDIQARLDTLREEHSDLRESQSEAATEERTAQRALTQAGATPKSCPTCARTWDRGDILKEEAEKALKAATASRKKSDDLVTRAKTKLGVVQGEYDAANAAWHALRDEAPVTELSEQCEDIDSASSAADRQVRLLEKEQARLEPGPDRTEVTTEETVLKERRAQHAKLNLKVAAAAAKLAELKQALQVVQYWQQAFSAAGIPNMVLRDALAPLNTIAKRLSARMTGGTLEVSYDTSRELASGDQKAELIIRVKNTLGSNRANGGSKGESGLTNLIIAETLAEVGGVASRIGYRWYDEVCPNQDPLVRRALYTYLAEVAERYKILVFLVTHAPEAANYANHILTAEKTVKGTTYRWGV